MQKPSHDDRGFKASLRSALQRLSPALWQAIASCIDLLAGRYETALAGAEAKHQAALRRIENLEKSIGEQHRVEQVRTFMDWIDNAPLAESLLVSIVLPTRDRRELLERAIASVTAQSYGKWELVIVDDGSVDRTPDFLAGISDPRIRSHRSDGKGACAARNVALAHLKGDIVTYLDDDNLMHPNWLKSVVWAFSQRPETSVLYGAFLVDDFARVDPRNKGELPRLFFLALQSSRSCRRQYRRCGLHCPPRGPPRGAIRRDLTGNGGLGFAPALDPRDAAFRPAGDRLLLHDRRA